MTEVLVEYENVNGEDASVWAARACGRPLKEKWEAWIEFIPLSAGQFPVRTPRETTQRDRESAVEWATGITPTYLEGALERARERPIAIATEVAPPLFETPAPLIRKVIVAGPKPDAILDPYAVFAQGEDLLSISSQRSTPNIFETSCAHTRSRRRKQRWSLRELS